MMKVPENLFEPEGWIEDLLIFFLTLIPAFIVGAIIYAMGSDVYIPVLAVVSNFYFVVGVGWITSPAIGIAAGLHPLGVLVLLVFVSMESSLVVSVNYDLLEKTPLIGKFMKKIREKALKTIEKYSLARGIEYVSIFWLMFLPLYGTGPMIMSFVGRILGLDWLKVWLTIGLSALARYTLLVLFVYYGIFTWI